MSYKTTIASEWRGREVKIKGNKVTGKSVFETGLIVEGQAKLLTPVDTGRLAASITTQTKNDGNTAPSGKGAVGTDVIAAPIVDNQAYVGTPVFYGPYQEYGTIRSEAQPFLRPALALAQGRTLTIFEANGRLQFREFLR